MILRTKKKKSGPKHCKATTKNGRQCKNHPVGGASYCHLHKKELTLNVTCVVQEVATDRLKSCMKSMLDTTLFWKHLEKERKKTPFKKAEFAICIKVDLDVFNAGSSTGTCPSVVETLIELLHDRGYFSVAVADSMASSSSWLENRDVLVVADLIGYQYQTSDGKPYDVVNLSDDCVGDIFPETHFLHLLRLSRYWTEANFRICFSKNKTDDESGYGLCLKSLINVLPHKDKEYHYAHRYNSAELAVELLQTTPVHFSLIDGVSSNHGQQGSRYSRPIDTKVLIGSPDLLLTDWTGALKMGVDPYISPINALGLKNKGLPETYELRGDLSPYSGWENVHPMVIHSVQKRNSHFAIRKLLRPWFTTVNRELFPFKNPLDDRINSMLTELLNKEVGSKRSESMLMLVNYLIGFFSGIYSSYTISLDKDRVYRKDTDIGFDYTAFSEEDHKNVIQYMKPFAAIAKSCVPDKNGLRWRYIDKSVVFIYDRILPVPYEDFVKKVDISSAVRMMNDNVGGTCLPVLWDEQKRVRHQVERDIYLPQPNWMSMYGGDFIDVGKIECITYEKDSKNIYWKSVASVNNSTLHDDGIVTFERVSQSTTKITIVARQQFALPPLWQIIDMDLIPEFKNQLVSDSYITFFSRTMANYEAMYEGRNVETGCKYDPNFGEDCYEKGSTDILHTFANRFAGFLEPFLAWASQSIMTPDLEKILSSVFGSKWEEKKASFPSNTSSTPLKDFLDTVVHDLVSVAQKDIEFWSKVSRKESA